MRPSSSRSPRAAIGVQVTCIGPMAISASMIRGASAPDISRPPRIGRWSASTAVSEIAPSIASRSCCSMRSVNRSHSVRTAVDASATRGRLGLERLVEGLEARRRVRPVVQLEQLAAVDAADLVDGAQLEHHRLGPLGAVRDLGEAEAITALLDRLDPALRDAELDEHVPRVDHRCLPEHLVAADHGAMVDADRCGARSARAASHSRARMASEEARIARTAAFSGGASARAARCSIRAIAVSRSSSSKTSLRKRRSSSSTPRSCSTRSLRRGRRTRLG